MNTRFQYILAALIITIVYEVYLIVFYSYKDFQINSYISYLGDENTKIERVLEKKKEYLSYVKTNAFLDRMAKASQNRKNPGEDVVFVVNQNDVKDYKKLDTDQMIVAAPKTVSKTLNMSNREKWAYYILRYDIRD